MKRRLFLMMSFLLFMIGTSFAQTDVSGTIISKEDGQPVVGATIQVVGSGTGAISDIDGKFKLTLPQGRKTLRISYVGMESQDVTAKSNMRIVMIPVQKSIDEVIVVAYGTAKKSAFTGSAKVLESDDLTKVQSTNPIEAMKGKVAGVQMVSKSGAPGSTSAIRIRGISSINAGNAPLIILDGAPYDGNLNLINPQEIESQTVLKDAASAALYGARGANGVILITTKNGRKGRSSITVDAKVGANSRQMPLHNYVNNPAGYYELYFNGLYNYAVNKLNMSQDQALGWANQNLVDPDPDNSYSLGYNVYNVPEGEWMIGRNLKLNPHATLGRVIENNGKKYMLMPDDWMKESFRTGVRQEYSMTANGSTDKSSFFGSASYLKIDGITPGSDYSRFSSRLKADYQMKTWLKLFGNFSYSHYETNSLRNDGESNKPTNLFAMAQMAPIYPLYIRDAEGNILINQNTNLPEVDYGNGAVLGLTRQFMKDGNPLNDSQINHNGGIGHNATAAGTAEIRFLKDFKFTSSNSALIGEYRGTTTYNPWFGETASQKGHIFKKHDRTWTYNLQQLLNYHHVFDAHDVEVMLGHEYFRSHYEELSADKLKTFSNESVELDQAVQVGQSGSYASDYNTEGWFGRAQYNYEGRYFTSVSYRRDGSSRFHPDHRWGNFWSLGGAWNINQEKWFDSKIVDLLKFKISYGEQGNDRIGAFRYTTTYNIENSNGEVSLTPNSLGNDKITWEKGGNMNTGIEFSLWNGRLNGDIEYFYRTTTDMLSWVKTPGSTGFAGYYNNVGDMRNSGLEIDLNGDIIRTKDITWSANVNFTTYKNKITRLADNRKNSEIDGVRGYNDGSYFYGEGLPIYTWRLYKYAGVDQNTGEALYYKKIFKTDDKNQIVKDANGNDIVEKEITTTNAGEASYYTCGTSLPDAYGGFGTSLNAYGFDLSIDFNYQIGGNVLDGAYISAMNMNRGAQMHADLLNAWTPQNKNTDIPRLQYGDVNANKLSDRFLINGSYLCLQNITLGYTLPNRITTLLGLEKMRIYAVGDNIWLWSKRQGLDPRQYIDGGAGNASYSPIRTISGGVSITF